MRAKMATKKTILWSYSTAKEHQEIRVSWRKALRFARKQKAAARGLPNGKLLEETVGAASGDEPDGSMSSQGRLIYGQLEAELRRRLVACGYLDDEHGYHVPEAVKIPTEKRLQEFCALFETVAEEKAIRKCVRWLLKLSKEA
jgi:hypothetical protein